MPLAVTREAIGWTTVDEIQPQNGVYTLYEASAAYADKTKKQAVKVKPPFSPTEYFVIEYRKKAKDTNLIHWIRQRWQTALLYIE